MRIIVNHLTRMAQGYICVAGLDLETGAHIRPVIRGARLSTNLLARNGGPFDMAVIVDLGTAQPAPSRPEVEDHLFDSSRTQAVRTPGPNRFWRLLVQVAKPKLSAIFGEALKRRGAKSCAVDVGEGKASLGCLLPSGSPEVYLRARLGGPPQIRMRVSDGEFVLDLGVTDIRLYGADHITPNRNAVNRIARRLAEGRELVLSVGLTRPYASSSSFAPVHWLQVNNIHLEDDPIWQLG